MRSYALVFAFAFGAGVALGSAPALAQQDGEFSVQRFEPAPGPNNVLTVEGARTEGEMAWSAGLLANYSYRPFVVRSCVSKTNCDEPNRVLHNDLAIVKDMFTADLLGSFTPIQRLQIGLRVPLTFVNGDGVDVSNGQSAGGMSGFAIGDPTLEGKYRFYGDSRSLLAFAGGAFVSFPVGHAMAEDKYIGYSSFVGGIRGIADYRDGPLYIAANLSTLYRSSATLGTTKLGPEFRYGVAASFDISPLFTVLGEGYGGTKFSTKNGSNSLEIDLGVRFTPLQSRFAFTAGGGAGLIRGVGVPDFRAFVGVLYTYIALDTDGDGIPDNIDQCPLEPEDFDGFEDEDGCPDPDNDGDGIPDHLDKCPNEPETYNGFEDEDGCPDDIPDKDSDGIADYEDMCPDEGGEVVRSKGPYYGCPDRDHDGVPDSIDKCPEEPEDYDGFEDEDGCPDPDNDGDGIPDEEDHCPDDPGPPENNGCPAE